MNETASTVDAQVGMAATGSKRPFKELVAILRRRIDATLEPFIPRGSKCVLMNFPRQETIGDVAIWLGQRAWLHRCGVEVIDTDDPRGRNFNRFAKRLGAKDLILLRGGGNFGDLYPARQRFREAILAAFPRQTIIQLPQTLCFTQETSLQRARAAVAKHRRLIVFVRDHQSLEVARNVLGVPSFLCPDMAFALGPLPRSARPSLEVLWLWRKHASPESCRRAPVRCPGDGLADWSDGEPPALLRFDGFLSQQFQRHPLAFSALQRLWEIATDERLAKARFAMGCRMLNQAHIVITDRLHGHILSLLLDIPHVLFDDRYGKLRRFYDTWTGSGDLTRWAQSPEEAREQARLLCHLVSQRQA